jgi:transposase
MAYPVIMRQKALEQLRKGRTKTQVNEMYGLSNNVLKEWEELEAETGSLQPRPIDRKPTKIDREELRKYCKENPLATHKEAAEHFNCSEAGIRKAKKIMGITRKKRQSTTQNETKKNENHLPKY